MATIRDLDNIRKLMDEVKEHPNQLRWYYGYRILYLGGGKREVWSIEYACDLAIYFDTIKFRSNCLEFWRNGMMVGSVMHFGLYKMDRGD